MEIKIVCGSLCLFAFLLFFLLITRDREGFATLNTKLTLEDSILPNQSNPNAKPTFSFRVDVSGNEGIPVSISNLSDVSSERLNGKNLPRTIDDKTNVTASKMKADTDTIAEMRRIARKEIQDTRRFDTSVIDDEDNETYDNDYNEEYSEEHDKEHGEESGEIDYSSVSGCRRPKKPACNMNNSCNICN